MVKHPDQEVQGRLGLVFTTFLQVKSACPGRTLLQRPRLAPAPQRPFRRHRLAATDRPGHLSILKNPAYAGAFVYGRTRAVPRASAPHQRVQKPLPMAEWKVCHKDRYPAYIAWDTFEKIQTMVGDNHSEYDRNKTRGIPRRGKALLHGLVYCGECGHKMVVQYKNRTCYICNYLRQQYQVPVCQNLPVDAAFMILRSRLRLSGSGVDKRAGLQDVIGTVYISTFGRVYIAKRGRGYSRV